MCKLHIPRAWRSLNPRNKLSYLSCLATTYPPGGEKESGGRAASRAQIKKRRGGVEFAKQINK